jgi:hypothetical protein
MYASETGERKTLLTPRARTRLFSAAVDPLPTIHQTPDIADDYFEDEQPDSVQ